MLGKGVYSKFSQFSQSSVQFSVLSFTDLYRMVWYGMVWYGMVEVCGIAGIFLFYTIPYHGVLPSTQPVATIGSSFILLSFDLACTCWLVLLKGGG